ncbi:MAG: hypothetical protein EZS28_045791, partial [Streblomastix strix]
MFMNGFFLHLQHSALSSQSTYEPMVFNMDNALFHHDISVLHLLQDNNHKVLYIAPYSCEINPIEVLQKQPLQIEDLKRIFIQQLDMAGELTIFDIEIEQDTSKDGNVDMKNQKRCREILDLQDEKNILVQQPIQRKRSRISSATNSSHTSNSDQIFAHINDSGLCANSLTSTAPINSHTTTSGQIFAHINDSG